MGSDKSLKSFGGCQRYRPDKLYIGLKMVELDECDEHQHKYLVNYSCDERRVSEIYEEDGICGKNMVVIRWNPDYYTPPKGKNKQSRKDRLIMYKQLKLKLRKKQHTDKIHIYYMFYSDDIRRI